MPDKIAQWLAENTNEKPPVFFEEEIPRDIIRALDRAALSSRVPGRIVVIHSPTDQPESARKAVFWSIVEKIAARYKPAVIERDSAVRLHIGENTPGAEIRIRHTGRSRWRSEILPGVFVRLEHGPVIDAVPVQVGEARIPVESPERILLSLPLHFLKEEEPLRNLALWLKSLVLAKPAVIAAYHESPRPVVLKRVANLARDAGNERLGQLLDDVVASEQSVRISRRRTGVGSELAVPKVIAELKTTRQPWLDRLRLAFHESRQQISSLVPSSLFAKRDPDLTSLLEMARESKANDAYHSSSIEGYRLRLEEVVALLTGRIGEGPSIEDVSARLAVVGYGNAFDALLKRVEEHTGMVDLTPGLALDLCADLFTPSVEAGLVDRDALRAFRNGPVFIRDTLYTPPNADKVPALMDLLFEELRRVPISEGYLRASLVHLWFVWIHPFPDGNGRVARFLMNSALLASREPWLTIRVEQRNEYFLALRHAQLSEDYAPFARFVANCAMEAVDRVENALRG